MTTGRAFRDAFGAFPTGVAVVTAATAHGPVGLTTNAVTSVSLEPALFLVCFASTSRTLPAVLEAGELGVSVLRASQEPMASRFASKSEPAHKFHGIDLDDLGGIPVIAGAAANLTGSIEEVMRGGDHEIVLCRCLATRQDDGAEPLVFHRGRFGELAGSPSVTPTG